MIRRFTLAALAALAAAASIGAQAQLASAPASAAKKELAAKVLKLQQPGVEGFARNIVQQNALQVLQAAGQAVQRLPAERRDAVWQDVQADARKFSEESFPIVRDRAVKLMPTTIGPLIEERFTEDELKQLVVLLESPVGKKFASMNGEMLKTLADKLMPDVKPLVEPKMKAFQDSVRKRLPAPAAGAAPAK